MSNNTSTPKRMFFKKKITNSTDYFESGESSSNESFNSSLDFLTKSPTSFQSNISPTSNMEIKTNNG